MRSTILIRQIVLFFYFAVVCFCETVNVRIIETDLELGTRIKNFLLEAWSVYRTRKNWGVLQSCGNYVPGRLQCKSSWSQGSCNTIPDSGLLTISWVPFEKYSDLYASYERTLSSRACYDCRKGDQNCFVPMFETVHSFCDCTNCKPSQNEQVCLRSCDQKCVTQCITNTACIQQCQKLCQINCASDAVNSVSTNTCQLCWATYECECSETQTSTEVLERPQFNQNTLSLSLISNVESNQDQNTLLLSNVEPNQVNLETGSQIQLPFRRRNLLAIFVIIMASVALGTAIYSAVQSSQTAALAAENQARLDALAKEKDAITKRCQNFLQDNPERMPKQILTKTCPDTVSLEPERECLVSPFDQDINLKKLTGSFTHVFSETFENDFVRTYGLNMECLTRDTALTLPVCGRENEHDLYEGLFSRNEKSEYSLCYSSKNIMIDMYKNGLDVVMNMTRDIYTHALHPTAVQRLAFALNVPGMPYVAFEEPARLLIYSGDDCSSDTLVRSEIIFDQDRTIFVGLENTVVNSFTRKENPQDSSFIARNEFSADILKDTKGELSFRFKRPFGFFCECPDGYETVISSMDDMYLQTGFHQCSKCASNKISVPFTSRCGMESFQCQSCPRGQFPDSKQTNCEQCSYNNFEIYDVQKMECSVCSTLQYWSWHANQQLPECKNIPTLQIRYENQGNTACKVNIVSYDHYVPERSTNLEIIKQVPSNHFVNIDENTGLFEVISCASLPEPPIKLFRHLCGRQSTDGVYVLLDNVNQQLGAEWHIIDEGGIFSFDASQQNGISQTFAS